MGDGDRDVYLLQTQFVLLITGYTWEGDEDVLVAIYL